MAATDEESRLRSHGVLFREVADNMLAVGFRHES